MLSIIIPSYNERDNIVPLTAQIKEALGDSCEYETLFVDDSTDDTPQLLEELSKTDSHLRYIHRNEKSGLASAVVCGFEHAKGDILAVMDADLQHPPQLLRQMLDKIDEGIEVVLPSRYVNGGGSEGLSPIRVLASKSARFAARIFLKAMRNVSDPMSGFFMIRKSVIDGVKLRPIGWKILMEVLVLGHYNKVAEIPYGFEKRYAGESKLSFRVTAEYFMHIVSLVLRSEQDRRFYSFALVGLSGFCIDMTVFNYLIAHQQLQLNLAATLSACCGVVSNYILNRTFTWRSKRSSSVAAEFMRYALVCGIGIAIKNVGVFAVSFTGASAIVCNISGIACSTFSNYFLTNYWVFKSEQ